MVSSDSNADMAAETETSGSDGDEPLELDPDEVLEINPSAEEAFSPE